MNDFQAKSAFIIKRYAIVLETQCLTSHVKSLNYEYLCKSVFAYHFECLWIVSLCMGTWGRRFLLVFSSNGRFFSGEIVACQELFYLLALPVSSAQSAAHFLAGFSAVVARVALSNLTEMAMRSLLQSLLLRTPLRQWRSSRLRFCRNSIQRLNRVQGTTIRLDTDWWYCSLRFATQVLNFPTNCSSCNAPAETRMKVVGILPASFSCWVLTVNIITYSRCCRLS